MSVLATLVGMVQPAIMSSMDMTVNVGQDMADTRVKNVSTEWGTRGSHMGITWVPCVYYDVSYVNGYIGYTCICQSGYGGYTCEKREYCVGNTWVSCINHMGIPHGCRTEILNMATIIIHWVVSVCRMSIATYQSEYGGYTDEEREY